MSDGYNGWTNYETWCAHLWLDSTEASQKRVRDLAKFLKDPPLLADYLRGEHAPPECIDNTMYRDLLQGALDEINWLEVAKAFSEADEE